MNFVHRGTANHVTRGQSVKKQILLTINTTACVKISRVKVVKVAEKGKSAGPYQNMIKIFVSSSLRS